MPNTFAPWVLISATYFAAPFNSHAMDGTESPATSSPPHSTSLDSLLLDGLQESPPKDLPPLPAQSPTATQATPDFEDPAALVQGIQRNMQRAANQLEPANGNLRQVVEIQREIVRDLQSFLKRLSATAGQSGQSSSSSAQAESEEGTGESDRAKGGSGRSTTLATDATTSPRTSNDAPASSWREASQRLWGTLPARQMQRLDALRQVEFLPEYKQLILDYYEQLSQETTP